MRTRRLRQFFSLVVIPAVCGFVLLIPASAQLPPPGSPINEPTQPGQLAKQPASTPKDDADVPFRVTTKTVLVPTTVLDKGGNYINGLTVNNFRLYDNEKLQTINQDFSYEPLSVVLVIQANIDSEPILPRLKPLGVLLQGLVTGETGEAAILAYDHRFRVIQDFTSDPDRLDDSMQKITAGSSSARLIDAVGEANRMLRKRGQNRRKVILLVSNARDRGSEGRLEETLRAAEFDNVLIYALDMSKFLSSMLRKADVPRPAHGGVPPEAVHTPVGTNNPTNVNQNQNLGNWLQIIPTLGREIKDLSQLTPAETFTRFTGGKEYSFAKQETLERAMTDIGRELRSQYVLSYSPNNQSEAGFHTIRVEVMNRGDSLEIRKRSGYWWAGGK